MDRKELEQLMRDYPGRQPPGTAVRIVHGVHQQVVIDGTGPVRRADYAWELSAVLNLAPPWWRQGFERLVRRGLPVGERWTADDLVTYGALLAYGVLTRGPLHQVGEALLRAFDQQIEEALRRDASEGIDHEVLQCWRETEDRPGLAYPDSTLGPPPVKRTGDRKSGRRRKRPPKRWSLPVGPQTGP